MENTMQPFAWEIMKWGTIDFTIKKVGKLKFSLPTDVFGQLLSKMTSMNLHVFKASKPNTFIDLLKIHSI